MSVFLDYYNALCLAVCFFGQFLPSTLKTVQNIVITSLVGSQVSE